MGKRAVPIWSKEVQKKLIDMDMSKKDLARELKVNYTQICNVLSGYVNNETIQEKICTFLKI